MKRAIQNMISISLKNGALQEAFNKDSNAFLLDSPRGAYTTMRTLQNQKAIFQFKYHVHRLKQSADYMMEEEKSNTALDNPRYDISTLDTDLFQIIKDNVRAGVQEFKNIDAEKELKITTLLTWQLYGGKGYDVYTHVTYLPTRPTNPVLVDVKRGTRVKMRAKDSVWVEERKALPTSHCSNEVIMCEDDGSVREGTSSNFFVIKQDGKVYTADQGILKGTVQVLLLEQVVKHNVVLAIPNLKDLSQWKEAFITSTSRLVLPIHSLVIAPDCMEFVDPLAIPQMKDGVYQLLSDIKQAPISEDLNNKLMDHMLEMSEYL